ncbi:MAG: hypothetical protein V3U84_06515 [Thiotrichaceae bacterium]
MAIRSVNILGMLEALGLDISLSMAKLDEKPHDKLQGYAQYVPACFIDVMSSSPSPRILIPVFRYWSTQATEGNSEQV